ncbi:hypothetical protein D555_0891 [Bordetella holmesii 35009]|nr:hypothetical protein D555_0891 [Bordetella holmesii 35009]
MEAGGGDDMDDFRLLLSILYIIILCISARHTPWPTGGSARAAGTRAKLTLLCARAVRLTISHAGGERRCLCMPTCACLRDALERSRVRHQCRARPGGSPRLLRPDPTLPLPRLR